MTTNTAVTIIGEDDFAWFTQCDGGCGLVHAHPKRIGHPQFDAAARAQGRYVEVVVGTVWETLTVDSVEPKRCLNCGPFPR